MCGCSESLTIRLNFSGLLDSAVVMRLALTLREEITSRTKKRNVGILDSIYSNEIIAFLSCVYVGGGVYFLIRT
jgi:hypothetical protein